MAAPQAAVGTWSDWSLFAFWIATSVEAVAIVVYILRHRMWPPLRARHPRLLAVQTVAGIAWIAGAFGANNHFSYGPPIPGTSCSLWSWWLQQVIGQALWTACLFIRVARLVVVFRLRRRSRAPIAFAAATISSAATVACFVEADDACAITGQDGSCHTTGGYKGALVAVIVFRLLALVCLWYLLRHVRNREAFHQDRELRHGVVLLLALFALAAILNFTDALETPAGRFFYTGAELLSVLYFFIISAVEPAWKCFTKDGHYLETFKRSIDAGMRTPPVSCSSTMCCQLMREALLSYAERTASGDGAGMRHTLACLREIYQRDERTTNEERGLDTRRIVSVYLMQMSPCIPLGVTETHRAQIMQCGAEQTGTLAILDDVRDALTKQVRDHYYDDFRRQQCYVDLSQEISERGGELRLLSHMGAVESGYGYRGTPPPPPH